MPLQPRKPHGGFTPALGWVTTSSKHVLGYPPIRQTTKLPAAMPTRPCQAHGLSLRRIKPIGHTSGPLMSPGAGKPGPQDRIKQAGRLVPGQDADQHAPALGRVPYGRDGGETRHLRQRSAVRQLAPSVLTWKDLSGNHSLRPGYGAPEQSCRCASPAGGDHAPLGKSTAPKQAILPPGRQSQRTPQTSARHEPEGRRQCRRFFWRSTQKWRPILQDHWEQASVPVG